MGQRAGQSDDVVSLSRVNPREAKIVLEDWVLGKLKP
jgi:hypothetical protein